MCAPFMFDYMIEKLVALLNAETFIGNILLGFYQYCQCTILGAPDLLSD